MGKDNWSTDPANNDVQGNVDWSEGMNPSEVNDTGRQMMADDAKWRNDTHGENTSTGSSGSYVLTTDTSLTALAAGISLTFQANHSSPSGGSTLNVDGLGAKSILAIGDSGERELFENEIDSDGFYRVIYDPDADSSSGAWILLNSGLDDSQFENAIIDGDFDYWPEGTSGFTTDGYTACMWLLDLGGGAGEVSRQTYTLGQTDVPGNPKYYIRLAVTTGAAGCGIEQRIEGVETFAGQVATVTIFANGSNPGGGNLVINCIQNFGTGGSPSSTVTTEVDTVTLTGSDQKFSFSFTVPSISGKTLGTNGDDYVSIQVCQPSGDSSSDAWTLNKGHVSFVKGDATNVADVYQKQDLATVIKRCERYFEPIFGGFSGWMFNAGAGRPIFADNFKSEKRGDPDFTIEDDSWPYDAPGGSGSTSSGTSVINSSIDEKGFKVQVDGFTTGLTPGQALSVDVSSTLLISIDARL